MFVYFNSCTAIYCGGFNLDLWAEVSPLSEKRCGHDMASIC